MSMDSDLKNINGLISNSKSPIVFFDADTDGSCSYIQLRRTFEQIKEGYSLSKDDDSQAMCREKIFDNHDLIIFVDTPYVQEDFFKEAKGRQIIWIDHHPMDVDACLVEYPNILYFNPLKYDKLDGRCTSYWVYRVCSREENLFFAAMASVADFYLFDILIDFYNYDKDSFNVLFKMPEKKRLELFEFISKSDFRDESLYSQRANWIQYLSYECGLIMFKNFFDILYKVEKWGDAVKVLRKVSGMSSLDFKVELMNGKMGYFEKFHEIMAEYKKIYSKATKVKGTPLVLVEHDNCVMSFNRQISEELAYRLDDWKVICSCYYKDKYDTVSCSLRGNGVKVNELLEICLKGIGRGGGHDFAAGAITTKKNFPEFRRRLEKEINN